MIKFLKFTLPCFMVLLFGFYFFVSEPNAEKSYESAPRELSSVDLEAIDLIPEPRTIALSPIVLSNPLKTASRAPIKKDSKMQKAIREAGLDPKIFEGWFNEGEPGAIHFWTKGGLVEIPGPLPGGSGIGAGKIINIADKEGVAAVNSERSRDSLEADIERDRLPGLDEGVTPLPENSYSYVSFDPGRKDDGNRNVDRPKDPGASSRGPDHTLSHIDDTQYELLKELREKTISLGHGGEVVFEVSEGGLIFNKEGFDFVIYENPFYKDGKLFQEFARVGVAMVNQPDAYKWFSCDPYGNPKGCAGFVPTSEGGDRFDLSLVGLERAKYIKIKDTGTNMNNPLRTRGEKENVYDTEGFDLDALKILNGFKFRN